MKGCHGVYETSCSFELEVFFQVQRFNHRFMAVPFRVSLVASGHSGQMSMSKGTMTDCSSCLSLSSKESEYLEHDYIYVTSPP